MDGEGCGERIAFLEPTKVKPGHGRPSASAIQPLPPPGAHFVADPRDRHRVPGDSIVAVVAAEFPGEHRVLPGDRRVSMLQHHWAVARRARPSRARAVLRLMTQE